MGLQLFDRRTAVYGGIILATTLGFVSFGRLAMSDMLLTLWSTLAMALAVAAFRDGSASGWYIPALGAVLGLGFQTKGPVALLLPGLGILALLWQRRRQRWPITLRRLLLALALFAVVGLGWFAIVYLRLGAEPLAHFFLRENLERFAACHLRCRSPRLVVLSPSLSGLWLALVAVPGRGQLARVCGVTRKTGTVVCSWGGWG